MNAFNESEATLKLVEDAIKETLKHPEMGLKSFGRPNGSCLVIEGKEVRTAEVNLMFLRKVTFTDDTENIPFACKPNDPDKRAKVKYFRFNLPPNIFAHQMVTPIGDLTDEELKDIRVVRSLHQDNGKTNKVEFTHPSLKKKVVDFGYIITGPTKDANGKEVTVMWTVFYGVVTAFNDTSLLTIKTEG